MGAVRFEKWMNTITGQTKIVSYGWKPVLNNWRFIKYVWA